MKCKLTEMWHRSPEGCKCVTQLHLNLNNKYCICFFSEPNSKDNYCGDTWKIVNQVAAKIIWEGINIGDWRDKLEEFFEYV